MKNQFLSIITLLLLVACGSEKNTSFDIPLNNDWMFSLNDQPEAFQKDFYASNWTEVDLPHDFSILQPFDKNNPSGKSGGYAYSGLGWYRKTFRLPETAKNKRVVITFNGVYKNSEVWINEHYLGKRPNGYVSFTYDLTPYIRYNQENLIAVKADTKDQPASRWYTGAGMYRKVNLHISDPIHLVKDGIFIQTLTLDSTKATLSIDAEVSGNEKKAKATGLRVTVTNPSGKVLFQKTSTVQVRPNVINTFNKELKIRHPQLWSIEEPALYTIEVELVKKRKVLDRFSTKYGLRTFHFDPDKGFFLNGKSVKLKGTNNHHDGGPLGAACYDYTFVRQLQLLKEMGSNALRMSHNPPAPELLNSADSMGFVVINEIFDEWQYGKVPHNYASVFNNWNEQDIADWIRRDRNHPSIIAWSLGNEIPEQRSGEKGKELLEQLMETAAKHDTTRPFTSACNEIVHANNSGFSSVLDIVGYNYREPYYKKDHHAYPERVIYGSETAIYPYQPGDGFPLHSYNDWLEGQLKDYVAGEFLWTGFDYLGESGIGMGGTGLEPWNEWPAWPWRSAICGVFDICGFKKPAYYFRKALWDATPLVYLSTPTAEQGNDLKKVPFWGWPEVLPHWDLWKKGDTVKVHVYTNCSEVELFLNGTSLGTKEWNIQDAAFLTWEIAYEPGKLEAIGKMAGIQKSIHKIETAGRPSQLHLSTSKTKLVANQKDLTYIEVQLKDKEGNLCQFNDQEIHFSVEGSAEILAVGNGDPQSHTPFNGSVMETYHGKCLLIVKSTNKQGEATVNVFAENLPASPIKLFSEK